MKIRIKIDKFDSFATMDVTAEYEDGDSGVNFVRTTSGQRKCETTVFHKEISALELAILDAADEIRARKLQQRAEGM